MSPTLTCKEPLPEQQVDDPPCKWAGNRAFRRGPESRTKMYVYDIDRDCKDTSVVASRAWYCTINNGVQHSVNNGSWSWNRWFDIAVLLKTKFKRHILKEFQSYLWAFCPRHCSRLGWLKKERKKKRKMTKLNFHHFQVRHFNNVFEQSWCHCRVGATPARISNCLQRRRIHHQVKISAFER